MSKAAVFVRLSEDEEKVLEKLTEKEGVCRTEVIRRLIRAKAGPLEGKA